MSGPETSKRRSYTNQEKKRAIEMYELTPNAKQVSRVSGIPRKNIERWVASKGQIMKQSPVRRRLEGGGNKPQFEELEERVYVWLK